MNFRGVPLAKRVFRVFYPKDDLILNCPNAKYQCYICLVQKGIVKKFTVKENLKRNRIWNISQFYFDQYLNRILHRKITSGYRRPESGLQTSAEAPRVCRALFKYETDTMQLILGILDMVVAIVAKGCFVEIIQWSIWKKIMQLYDQW